MGEKKQKAVGTIHAGDDGVWDKNTNKEEAHFGRKQVGNHDKRRGVRTAHCMSDVDQGGDSHQSVFHQFPVVIKRPNVLSMNEPSLHRLHDVHNKFSARACFADEFVTEHVLSGLFRDAGVDSGPRPPRLGVVCVFDGTLTGGNFQGGVQHWVIALAIAPGGAL